MISMIKGRPKRLLYSALKYGYAELNTVNVGDVIQTIASAQFLPNIDYYVDRDNMRAFSSMPPSFLISNGWFLKVPDNFPPPENIHPFYISFHLSSERILTQKVIEHFRIHSPIGCRDQYTLEMLESKGIKCYLSGCLTVTLENKFNGRSKQVYLVDLDDDAMNLIPEWIKEKATLISHRKVPKDLSRMVLFELRSRIISEERWQERFNLLNLMKIWRAKEYAHFLPTQLKLYRDLIVVFQMIFGQKLIDLYAHAKLIITSRIHCAIPCMALGTPVILIKGHEIASSGRLGAYEMFQPIYCIEDGDNINWRPTPPDVSSQANFLRRLCKKAVKMRDNPLKFESLEAFKNAS